MTRAATMVPAETDLLCEGCGYTLNGLPESGNCPECGKPIAQSLGTHRLAPPWEDWPLGASSLIVTTARVIFRTTRFYRTLRTRPDEDASLFFARIHWGIAAAGFGIAAWFHAAWYLSLFGRDIMQFRILIIFLPIVIALTYVLLAVTTELAARLTHWEATYRGLRLPLPVVRRGLYFHAAHYLPVALMAAVTVVGYQALREANVVGPRWAVIYLYVLSAEVLIGAAYLFKTYWIGMKNMMFANR